MKKVLGIGLMAAALAVVGAPKAEAAMFVTLSSGAASITCDNGTLAGVSACTLAGFTTALNANVIGFGQLPTGFAGYTFSIGSGATAVNFPGDASSASVSDTKLDVTRTAGATADLNVLFGVYGFTAPAGPFLTLSSSQTGNWLTGAGNDNENFTGYASATNAKLVAGATQSAVTPVCANVPGDTDACSTSSGLFLWQRGGTEFSVFGLETIHMAVGDVSSFTGQVIVRQSNVPEPTSMVLLGTGLLGLATVARRRMRKA